METGRERIIPVYVEDEMKSSYIDYSMSVIVSRALPDARDGLKPSQRRILVAMNDLNLSPGAQHRKCAKICGDTSGNYHPHGEQVIYPTLVRLAQEFNMRYPLVEGQGNFGSIDGDPPAAMRYTEARMAGPAMEMLADLEKNTVDFTPNYDETREMPTVLPGRFPNLVCNGSSGIAVGMATNIPPHNLGEVVDGIVALIDNPEITDEEIHEHIKGPDFPTGGIIYGRQGIKDAYTTGRGLLTVRARAFLETTKAGRERIIVTEIPYTVNKAALIERVAEMVRDGKIEGVGDLRDESDREGMRIVIELKRDAQSTVVLNQLYKHSPMQTTFGVIMLALVDIEPRILTIKGLLQEYVKFRHQVILRRTRFDLDAAEKRAHILEGYKIALANIDAVIDLIKKSPTVDAARDALMRRFKLSEIQANAILNLTLQRLTGLERKKIDDEYLEVIKRIEHYKAILASLAMQMGIIKDELKELKEKYGDARRTEIVDAAAEDFNVEDLIAEEDMVISISHGGYIKRTPVTLYRRQHRGGKGVVGMETKEEDFVEHLFVASTHDYILFFTNSGKCYWKKVHELPEGGRYSKGKAFANLLDLEKEERITAFVSTKEFPPDRYLVMATRQGVIKKTELSAFSHPRRGGIIAITLDEGDTLIDARLTDGTNDIVLAKSGGKAVRFHEQDVRPMGRSARGVRGVTLEDDDHVVGMVVIAREGTLLVVSENGYGKRSPISEYRVTRRGGKGIITLRCTEKIGRLVALKEVVDEDELLIMSQGGAMIRVPIKGVSVIGRATQGVRLINLDEGDKVVDVARVVREEEGE
ncbi:MAG TPA: DNA gyrase subunit A [bacterium]|nr:DNA gyrase subunit A [bacterium]